MQKPNSKIHGFDRISPNFLCFDYLEKNGLPGTGEVCHSPMAFLANAMTSVLRLANEKAEKLEREALQKAKLDSVRQQADFDETLRVQEEREFGTKEAAFQAHFSNEESRRAYIAQFAKRYPILRATGVVIRNLAISEWWQSHRVVARVG